MKRNIRKDIKEGMNIKGMIIATLETVIGPEKGKKEIIVSNNIIVTSGLVAIGRRIVGEGLKANEGQATYIAVGTASTTPVVGNTTLGTELARKIKSSSSYISNVSKLRTFFTTAEGNGAIEEVGAFGEDATAAANSGTMINHALLTITKDATKTLTLEIVWTIS